MDGADDSADLVTEEEQDSDYGTTDDGSENPIYWQNSKVDENPDTSWIGWSQGRTYRQCRSVQS